ncbi:MAG: PAS domain S-box protein [Salinivirgaceae bacterium]|nr:PAS domain S-box protein [Salinivirgaceae bacterium]MDD4746169.1 PAS domain S-box protein [Salinivirgaceae bacterium]MDY0280413.1 PAS domain S-box protein [Salinivirgaceae bacterium]
MTKQLNILFLTTSYELYLIVESELRSTDINFEIKHFKSLSTLNGKIEPSKNNLIVVHHESEKNLDEFCESIELDYKKNSCIILSSTTEIQPIVRCVKKGIYNVFSPRALEEISKSILQYNEQLNEHPKESQTSITHPAIFKTLLENIDHIAVQGYNMQGNVIYWNKGSETLFGYKKEEVLDKNIIDFIIPRHLRLSISNEIDKILQNKANPYPRTIQLQRKDNSIANVYSYCRVFENKLGETELYFIDLDQTFQSDIQQKLETERAYFESLFNSTPLAIAVFNNDDQLVDCNLHFDKLFGYSKEDILGIKINKLIIPKELTEERNSLLKDVARGKTIYKETVRKTKYGKLIEVLVIGKPIILKGNRISVLALYEDITARKEAERTLLLAKEKAEASDKMKTIFLNNISHEIRTPLNGIIGFANLVIKPNISQHNKEEYFEILQTSSDRLLNTITNYMDASLLLTKSVTPTFTDVLLSSIIFDTYELFYTKIAKQNITFSMYLPDDSEDIIVKTDIEILRKITNQLLDNALKYTKNGRITIGFTQADTTIKLFIEDTGIGIPLDQQNNLFNHFTKLENTTNNIDGSGLGLSISKNFAKLINCTIEVESTHNQGSKFSIIFKHPHISNEINLKSPLKTHPVHKNNSYILIADDDDTSLLLLQRILNGITETPVVAVSNGQEAVDYYKEHPNANCILMDVKMPILDGYEATKIIKQIDGSVPIVAITAFAMIGDENNARENGCDDYMAKPFSVNQLTYILKKHNIPCKEIKLE